MSQGWDLNSFFWPQAGAQASRALEAPSIREDSSASSHGRSGSWPHVLSIVMNPSARSLPRGPAFVFWDVATPCCVLRQPRRSKETQPTPWLQPESRFGYAASRKFWDVGALLCSPPIPPSGCGRGRLPAKFSTSLQRRACPLCRSETAFISGAVSRLLKAVSQVFLVVLQAHGWSASVSSLLEVLCEPLAVTRFQLKLLMHLNRSSSNFSPKVAVTQLSPSGRPGCCPPFELLPPLRKTMARC